MWVGMGMYVIANVQNIYMLLLYVRRCGMLANIFVLPVYTGE